MIKFDRSRRAFSLVEILFAVIIIGVLTAVAIPSLFSQKSKADDSNAKQTLRTVQQLVRTAQDDSGSFTGALGGQTLAAYLTQMEKDIFFTEGTAATKPNGNVRSVSVYVDTTPDVAYMTVVGGKDPVDSTKFSCWGIRIKSDGSEATWYYRIVVNSNTDCTANKIGTTMPSAEALGLKKGDFPSK